MKVLRKRAQAQQCACVCVCVYSCTKARAKSRKTYRVRVLSCQEALQPDLPSTTKASRRSERQQLAVEVPLRDHSTSTAALKKFLCALGRRGEAHF